MDRSSGRRVAHHLAIDAGRRAALGAMGAAAVAAWAPGAAAAAPGGATLGRDTRWRRADLALRFLAVRDGRTVERGRETAGYRIYDDGSIVVHIHSESDSPAVVRDAIYTLDAAWRPRECLLRLQVDGRHEGSGWFRFEGDAATLEGWNAATGRVSQHVRLASPATALVAHPVTTDAMLAAAYEHGRGGPSMQRPRGVHLSSADAYGRTGPLLAPSDVFLDYAGRVRVDTPLGAAEADHYRLHLPDDGRPAAEPLQELWCLAGTSLLLRARAGGTYRTTYELTHLDVR